MDAEIEIAESLWRHAKILGKSPDPEKRIAAAKAEMRLKKELDQLKDLFRQQSELILSGKAVPA